MYKHPFPTYDPFVSIDFDRREYHEDADAYVQVNIQHPYHVKEPFREPFYDYINSTGKPKLVFESAVFRQNVTNDFYKKYFRFGWNSFLYNEATFGPTNNGDDRWNLIQKEHNIQIRPWRSTRGKYVLIILQHTIDTSLIRLIDQFGSYYKWLCYTIEKIQANTDLPIVIRPHPKHGTYNNFFEADKIPHITKEYDNVSWSKNQGKVGFNGGKFLEADLDDAHAVVGWTSNALTEAACYGVPVYAMSMGAMATPVSFFDMECIDEVRRCPDRQQWLNDLAYSQWTYQEIQNGTAWEHIKNADLSHT